MTGVGYRIFRSQFTWGQMCDQAIAFAATVDVINISHSSDGNYGTIIVWYRLFPERK